MCLWCQSLGSSLSSRSIWTRRAEQPFHHHSGTSGQVGVCSELTARLLSLFAKEGVGDGWGLSCLLCCKVAPPVAEDREQSDLNPPFASIPDNHTHTQLEGNPHFAEFKRDGPGGARGGLVPAPRQGPGGQAPLMVGAFVCAVPQLTQVDFFLLPRLPQSIEGRRPSRCGWISWRCTTEGAIAISKTSRCICLSSASYKPHSEPEPRYFAA